MNNTQKLLACIVINDGHQTYYLLKIERKGFDVYCFPPHLGMHYSVHETGEAHFKVEPNPGNPVKAPRVILSDGEAGIPFCRGSIRAPLSNLGRAVGICWAMLPINSLSTDFEIFNRSPKECFIMVLLHESETSHFQDTPFREIVTKRPR
jgi:hypothetical protein